MGHFPQPSTIINQGYQAAALLMDSDMAILPSRTEGPLLKGAAGLFGWKLGTEKGRGLKSIHTRHKNHHQPLFSSYNLKNGKIG